MKSNIIVVDDVRNLSDYELADLIKTVVAEKTHYQYSTNYEVYHYSAMDAIAVPWEYVGLHDLYHTCLRELFVPTRKLPNEKNKHHKKAVLKKYMESLRISSKVQRNKKNNISMEGNRISINSENTIYIIPEDITLFDALEEGDKRIKSAIGYAKSPSKYEDLSNHATTKIVKKKSLLKNKD